MWQVPFGPETRSSATMRAIRTKAIRRWSIKGRSLRRDPCCTFWQYVILLHHDFAIAEAVVIHVYGDWQTWVCQVGEGEREGILRKGQSELQKKNSRTRYNNMSVQAVALLPKTITDPCAATNRLLIHRGRLLLHNCTYRTEFWLTM